MGAKAPITDKNPHGVHAIKNKIITAERLKKIFEKNNAYLISHEVEDTVKHCNDNGAMFHCGLNAEGWAERIAKAEAYQQECEGQEASDNDVHFD